MSKAGDVVCISYLLGELVTARFQSTWKTTLLISAKIILYCFGFILWNNLPCVLCWSWPPLPPLVPFLSCLPKLVHTHHRNRRPKAVKSHRCAACCLTMSPVIRVDTLYMCRRHRSVYFASRAQHKIWRRQLRIRRDALYIIIDVLLSFEINPLAPIVFLF